MKIISRLVDRLCMAIYRRGRRVWEDSPERAALLEQERRAWKLRRVFPIMKTVRVSFPGEPPVEAQRLDRFPGSSRRWSISRGSP